MRMPSLYTGIRYNSCCGKIICSGCVYSVRLTTGKSTCPFCRAVAPKTDEEILKREKKRVEVGDAQAMYELGCLYGNGMHGLPQNRDKALELYLRAGELGCTKAYHNIGNDYWHGRGVERNEKKATHYSELAAMGGDVHARHNLGCDDANVGNYDRALKHFMISVGGGDHDSLKKIKQLYTNGDATKEDYAKALKAYQAYLSEIKSGDRDKAAAFSDDNKYYE